MPPICGQILQIFRFHTVCIVFTRTWSLQSTNLFVFRLIYQTINLGDFKRLVVDIFNVLNLQIRAH